MNLLFVCTSDLHLGEEDSVLTNLSLGEPVPDPRAPGPCMLALVNYLHAVKRWVNEGKPIPFLVLNGDVIELAVSTYPLAVSYFRVFLAEISKRRLFDRIIYVPGNHDHALWGLIRDTHFVHSLGRQPELSKHPTVEHVTQLSVPRESPVLQLLGSNLPMQVAPLPVLVANPAFRLQSWTGHDFLFHHGHLLEDLYKVLSLLKSRILSDISMKELRKEPLRDDVADLEAENWPWIDFIWSGFARAGRVGQTAERIYELMRKPEGVKVLTRRVSEIVRTDFDIPFVPDGLEDDLVRFVLKQALEREGVGSDERADPSKAPFNPDLKAMVERFIGFYMKKELADEGLPPAVDRTCFLSGHTHKPFMEDLQDEEAGFGKIAVANSGGWTVESEKHRANYRTGIILGSNSGDMALVTHKLDVRPEPDIQKRGSWGPALENLHEHEELGSSISKAVGVRLPYLKKRIRETKKLLKNLTK